MQSLIQALTFLTILPIPKHKSGLVCFSSESRDTSAAYPWAGLIIGTLTAGTAWFSSLLLGHWSVAVICTVAHIVITGGLHLDGIADLADGLGGGKDREKRLAIMADSRLGSFGALAMIAILGLQTVFIFEWLDTSFQIQRPAGMVFLPIALVPSISRGFIPLLMRVFPAARPGGMGDQTRGVVTRRSVFLALLSTASLAGICYFPAGLMIAALVFLPMAILGYVISRSLGGLTGDCYGALIETGDTVGFLGLLLVGL